MRNPFKVRLKMRNPLKVRFKMRNPLKVGEVLLVKKKKEKQLSLKSSELIQDEKKNERLMKIKIALVDITRKDMAMNKIIEKKKNTCEDLQPISKILELFIYK